MYTIKSKIEVIDDATNQVVTTYNDQKQLSATDDGIDLNFEVVKNPIGGPAVRPPKPPKF